MSGRVNSVKSDGRLRVDAVPSVLNRAIPQQATAGLGATWFNQVLATWCDNLCSHLRVLYVVVFEMCSIAAASPETFAPLQTGQPVIQPVMQ